MSDTVWIIVAGEEVGVPKRWWTGTEWSVDPGTAREYTLEGIQDEGHRLRQKLQWPWIRALKQGAEVKP